MTDDLKVQRLLADLVSCGQQAEYVARSGFAAYAADDQNGALLRNAGERILLKVATVVERLPADFKAKYSDIPWTIIVRMRNLADRLMDQFDDDLAWNTLANLVPKLVREVVPSADLAESERIQESLDELDDAAAFDAAMVEEGENLPWEQAKADLGWS